MSQIKKDNIGDDVLENICNVCDDKNRILYILREYKKFDIKKNSYYSFSASCYKISRFVNPKEIAYVEVFANEVSNKDQ